MANLAQQIQKRLRLRHPTRLLIFPQLLVKLHPTLRLLQGPLKILQLVQRLANIKIELSQLLAPLIRLRQQQPLSNILVVLDRSPEVLILPLEHRELDVGLHDELLGLLIGRLVLEIELECGLERETGQPGLAFADELGGSCELALGLRKIGLFGCFLLLLFLLDFLALSMVCPKVDHSSLLLTDPDQPLIDELGYLVDHFGLLHPVLDGVLPVLLSLVYLRHLALSHRKIREVRLS